MLESVFDAVCLPPDAASQVRKSLGLSTGDPLRIAFICGPGDVVGTFDHWSKREHDPRTPVIAYSSMFYSLITAIDAEALMLVEQSAIPKTPDPRFRFVHTTRDRSRRGIRYRLDQRNFASAVLRNLREYRPHVILVGTDAPDGLIARLPKGPKIIMTTHNTYWPMGARPTDLKARLKLAVTSRALRRIDTAINTSAECALQLAALGGPRDNSFVDFPQVLAHFFPEKPNRANAVRHLLFLGRIEANKGVFDLVHAFNLLAVDHPNLQLHFAGSGSDDAALKAEVEASTFKDRITVHGRLPATAVHELLAKTDLLVCPTRSDFYEGLALVVIEAAVHGVPSVVSSVVPAKQLVTGGCVEFPADDATALTEALRGVIDSPTEYARLCEYLVERRHLFMDRNGSWGSNLYRAMIA